MREILRRERKRHSLSAKKLSLALGQHHSYISRIERSLRTIDVVEFVDIARALGVDPKDLFAAFVDQTCSRGD